MRNSKVKMLTECAVMIALAFALSFAKVYQMPLGGSVTIASMLPVMLIGLKYGSLVGIGTGFVYSLTQAAQALAEGNVFPFCESGFTLIICVLFDYLVPFTVIGLAGIFKELKIVKNPEIAFYTGAVSVVVLRFVCHFITGVVIWGQWAPEGMGKYLYSLAYNGSFLAADFAVCLVAAILMLRKREIRRILGIAD